MWWRRYEGRKREGLGTRVEGLECTRGSGDTCPHFGLSTAGTQVGHVSACEAQEVLRVLRSFICHNTADGYCGQHGDHTCYYEDL